MRHVEGREPRLPRLRGLLNLAVADARGAHANVLGGAVDHRVNVLQVDVPAALGHIMRVAHLVAELRTTDGVEDRGLGVGAGIGLDLDRLDVLDEPVDLLVVHRATTVDAPRRHRREGTAVGEDETHLIG